MTVINPVPVVRNNLAAYRAQVMRDLAKNITARAKLDAELKLLDELAKVLAVEVTAAVVADDSDYNDT